jgi:hypothetical protein
MNLRLDTLTAARQEDARLAKLAKLGHFDEPVFPIPECIARYDYSSLVDVYHRYQRPLLRLMAGGLKPAYYDPNNDYFRTPDAEVLYLLVRHLQPQRILEVGVGHSTRIIKQAIVDGELTTEHVAIDPSPRIPVEDLVDKMFYSPFEETDMRRFWSDFGANDIVFIDSSHRISIGNDVVFMFLKALPGFRPGVIFHIHDIFLPYDYPSEWMVNCKFDWSEQYLLQSLLQNGKCDVLWPGYFLQKTSPSAADALPFLRSGRAQSFWLRLQ